MEKKKAFNYAAHTLTMFRIAATPYIEHKLKTTPPEQRTWGLMALTSAVVVSDKFDGWFARRGNPSRFGKYFDLFVDKFLVGRVLKTLVANEEISPAHLDINIGRETIVLGVRTLAEYNGTDSSPRGSGRLTATAQMGGVVLAASPLAAKENLVENAMRIGTALSVLSAVDLGVNLLRTYKQQNNQEAANVS